MKMQIIKILMLKVFSLLIMNYPNLQKTVIKNHLLNQFQKLLKNFQIKALTV